MPVPFFSGPTSSAPSRRTRPTTPSRQRSSPTPAESGRCSPKLYVTNYPAGDFRAMPALGGGHALLKWVTSFPGNPAKGLPTVTGLVLLSNAETGELEALLDAAAVTALRTAAAAVIAAETLCRSGAESIAVIGCGVNGAETARMFRALGSRRARSGTWTRPVPRPWRSGSAHTSRLRWPTRSRPTSSSP